MTVIKMTQFAQPYAGSNADIADFINPVRTTAQLEDITNEINTLDKFSGRSVWNSTLGQPVWADGDVAGDTWSIHDGSVIHSPHGSLTFIPESGFTGIGIVGDGNAFAITQSSGFGSKPQAAAKVFDTFDTYYNNGIAETPYSALNSGDTIPSTSSDPYDDHTGVWTAESGAAYGKRSLGYQSPTSSGASFDYWMESWRGWPAPDGNKIYVRWYFWIEEEGYLQWSLDGAHSTSATVVTVTPGSVVLNDASPSSFHTIVIVLNDSSYHRTVQTDPKISSTQCNIVDALPEDIDSGNTFYFRLNDSTKFIRVWDVASGASDLLQFSWTWELYGAAGNLENANTDAIARSGGVGTWNLLELELFHPQLEVDVNDGAIKAYLNGSLVGTGVTGDISNAGTWPFSGIIPRLIGVDTSAASERWVLPNNFIRLAEIYADTTTQRIEIADHATVLRSSTIREVCPITGWVDGRLDFIINQGEHTSLIDKYVYFVDENNTETLMGQYGTI